MWSEVVFKYRRLIYLMSLFVICGVGFGAKNLSVNSDARAFYSEDDIYMKRLKAFEDTFQPTRKAIFVMHTDLPLEQDQEKIHALKWLSEAVADLPDAMRVDSLATVSFPYEVDGDILIDPYIDYLCPNRCLQERLVALDDPLVVRRLVSADRRTLGVLGVFDIEADATAQLAAIAKAASELKQQFREKYPSIDIYLTGGIPVSQAYVAASRRDIGTLFLISGMLLLVLLTIFLGDIRSALLMLATAFSAVVVSMGAAGWSGIQLSSATTTVPIMVLTLVVASVMHLFTHFLRISSAGLDRVAAVTTSLNANYIPIILTTLTSAISLASLAFLSSPPLNELGYLAAIGMLAGGLMAITLTPLIMCYGKARTNSLANSWLQARLNSYARFIVHRTDISFVGLFVILMIGAGMAMLHLEDDFVAYLSESTEVRQDTDFALQYMAGPSHLEVDITARKTVFEPRFLAELDELTKRLRGAENVASATSLSDIMRNVVTAFGEEQEFESLSEDALAQYFFVYELGLRAGDSAADIINHGRNRTHVTLLLSSSKASDVREIEKAVAEWLKEGYSNMSGVITGENSPVAHLSTTNIPAIGKTVATSLIFTSVLLGAIFGSWRFGLNALIAIALPIICGLGAWGWISGEIGLSGAIVIAIALGVVVDDAIHLLYQLFRSVKSDEDAIESVAYSIHRVGVPIVATTAIFIIGFAPLMFSSFQVNVTFAAVTCLVLAASLIFDLLVFPKLMHWAAMRSHTRG